MSTINYDVYGHCVVCHINLVIEQAIDGKIQKRWSTEFDETQFLLNDGSRMRVCICKTCKAALKEADYSKIMDCVIKGWDKETEDLVKDEAKPEWDKERKEKYMDAYSKKEIVTKSEDIHNDEIEAHLISFHSLKTKKEKVEDGINK